MKVSFEHNFLIEKANPMKGLNQEKKNFNKERETLKSTGLPCGFLKLGEGLLLCLGMLDRFLHGCAVRKALKQREL